jgi:hypothetical protein
MRVPSADPSKVYKCVKCGQAVRVSAPKPVAAAPAAGEDPINPEPRGYMGELLIEAGVITEEQLQEALAVKTKKGGKTFQTLIDLGHLDKDDLHECLSKQPGVAAIDLKRFHIDTSLLELVPRELALENYVLPIDRLGKLLTVAMACPLDTKTIKDLEASTGLRVKSMLCRLDDIQAAVEKHYAPAKGEDQGAKMDDSVAGMFADIMARTRKAEDVIDELQDGAKDEAPITEEVVRQLRALVEDGSSTVKEVLPIVTACPALASAVVAVANSDIFGMPGQVQAVPTALALLDKRGAANIAAHLLNENL